MRFGVIFNGQRVESDASYYEDVLSFLSQTTPYSFGNAREFIFQAWDANRSLPVARRHSIPSVSPDAGVSQTGLVSQFMMGSTKPGFFSIVADPAVYNSNGTGAFCSFATWSDFKRAGGADALSNVRLVPWVPGTLRNDGACLVL